MLTRMQIFVTQNQNLLQKVALSPAREGSFSEKISKFVPKDLRFRNLLSQESQETFPDLANFETNI